jgi:hypothetical protein
VPDPLAPIVNGWVNKIRVAQDFKRKQFGETADECRKFYRGPYSKFLYERMKANKETSLDYEPGADEEDEGGLTFRVTINKAAEFVRLFGPNLYQRNPDRRVRPRRDYMAPLSYFGSSQDPAAIQAYMTIYQQVEQYRGRDEACAGLFEDLLVYNPTEHDLQGESRFVVDDALLTGMGLWWQEVVVHPSGLRTVGSFFDSVTNLILDPDAKRWEDCKWVARECCHPVYEVEDEYGYARGSLKGHFESIDSLAYSQGDQAANYARSQERSNDLIRYWKVWTKMGMGSRLRGVELDFPEVNQIMDEVGQFCYLAIAPGMKYPLNLPPWKQGTVEEVQQAVQWPIPFWLDQGRWPFVALAFHRDGDTLWPIAPLAPALGELRFINWVYSFLLGKIRVASRDVLVIVKSLADEAKSAIKHGRDYEVVELSQMEMDIDKIVKFIQHPAFHPEIYKILDHMIDLFEKRTGLNDLLYGQTDAVFRSAEEAQQKQQNASVRPADMAQQVEAAASECARMEMAAMAWTLQPQDVEPVVGPVGAWIWHDEVQSIPPQNLFHQFQCHVEAGSSRRPNREKDQANFQAAMNNLFAPFFQYAQGTGDVGPVNALISDWCRSMGVDPTRYLLKPMGMNPAMFPLVAAQVPGGPPAGGKSLPPGQPAPAQAA